MNGEKINEPFSDQDLFQACQRVAAIIFSHENGSKLGFVPQAVFLSDERAKNRIFAKGQTDQGLLLEFYYGLPLYIWTPWGCWQIGHTGSGWNDDLLSQLKDELGLKEFRGKIKNEKIGVEVGPIYSINKVNGKFLPEAIERPPEKRQPLEELKKWLSFFSLPDDV